MEANKQKQLLKLLMMQAIEILDIDDEKVRSNFLPRNEWTSEFDENKATLKQTLHMIRKVSINLSKKI